MQLHLMSIHFEVMFCVHGWKCNICLFFYFSTVILLVMSWIIECICENACAWLLMHMLLIHTFSIMNWYNCLFIKFGSSPPPIRSQHYLKLPVQFKPSTAGRHAGLLLIQSETSGSIVIQLTGEALPWIHHLPSSATSSCGQADWLAGFGWMLFSVLFIMGWMRVTEEKKEKLLRVK